MLNELKCGEHYCENTTGVRRYFRVVVKGDTCSSSIAEYAYGLAQLPRSLGEMPGEMLQHIAPREHGAAMLEQQRAQMWECVERNLGLAYRVALKFRNAMNNEDVDDIVHGACLSALCRACVTYDIARGDAQFSTYATRVVTRACIAHTRYESRLDRSQSARVLGSLSQGYDLEIHDQQNDVLGDIENLEIIELVLDKMSDADRQLYELRFIDNRTYYNIGVMLGLSEGATRARYQRMLERCREVL